MLLMSMMLSPKPPLLRKIGGCSISFVGEQDRYRGCIRQSALIDVGGSLSIAVFATGLRMGGAPPAWQLSGTAPFYVNEAWV